MLVENILENKKKCKYCKIEKELQEFPISNTKKGKSIKPYCKICFNKIEKERYFNKNKEKIEERKKKIFLSKKEYNSQYYKKNKDKILKQVKEYSVNNKEKISKRSSKYYKKNKDKILQKIKNKREHINKYTRERRKNNINLRIAHNLRVRIRCAIKKNLKWKKCKDILGCELSELKNYLEKQFKDGMTWDNYGSFWHIDHIIPCSSFNLSTEDEQQKCFHYTNLQPLTAQENLIKSDKIF
jgi:hypothetical protein